MSQSKQEYFHTDDDEDMEHRMLPAPPLTTSQNKEKSSNQNDSHKYYEYTLQSFNYNNESEGQRNSTSHFNQEFGNRVVRMPSQKESMQSHDSGNTTKLVETFSPEIY